MAGQPLKSPTHLALPKWREPRKKSKRHAPTPTTAQSKLLIPFSEGTHVQEHTSTWQSDTTARTNVRYFTLKKAFFWVWNNKVRVSSSAQWEESFFPKTSVTIVILFWLKWAGYLAVAGLNLLAQLSDRRSQTSFFRWFVTNTGWFVNTRWKEWVWEIKTNAADASATIQKNLAKKRSGLNWAEQKSIIKSELFYIV